MTVPVITGKQLRIVFVQGQTLIGDVYDPDPEAPTFELRDALVVYPNQQGFMLAIPGGGPLDNSVLEIRRSNVAYTGAVMKEVVGMYEGVIEQVRLAKSGIVGVNQIPPGRMQHVRS